MIADLKDFEKLLKICRKQGVADFSMEGISVKFGDLPLKANAAEDYEETPTEELTPEQLMFYAVGSQT